MESQIRRNSFFYIIKKSCEFRKSAKLFLHVITVPGYTGVLKVVFCRCVDVTGAYSAQKTELNISLTAVGLLWTTTDFVAKGLPRGPAEEKETGEALEIWLLAFPITDSGFQQ